MLLRARQRGAAAGAVCQATMPVPAAGALRHALRPQSGSQLHSEGQAHARSSEVRPLHVHANIAPFERRMPSSSTASPHSACSVPERQLYYGSITIQALSRGMQVCSQFAVSLQSDEGGCASWPAWCHAALLHVQSHAQRGDILQSCTCVVPAAYIPASQTAGCTRHMLAPSC